jgi:hypothetical protein
LIFPWTGSSLSVVSNLRKVSRMYLNSHMQTLLFFHLLEIMSMHMPTLLQMIFFIHRIQRIQILSLYIQMQSQCIQMQLQIQSHSRGPSGLRLLFEMQGILLGIQIMLGGIDLISRSLLFYSLPLNSCHPGIFSWFSLHIYIHMARLLEIPHAGGVQIPPREPH